MTSDFCYFIYDDDSECNNPGPYFAIIPSESYDPDATMISCKDHLSFFTDFKSIKVEVREIN